MWSQSKFNNKNNKKHWLSYFFFIVNCEWILTLCSILAIVNFELHLFTGPKTTSDVLIKVKKRWVGNSGVVFLKKHRLNHFRKPEMVFQPSQTYLFICKTSWRSFEDVLKKF